MTVESILEQYLLFKEYQIHSMLLMLSLLHVFSDGVCWGRPSCFSLNYDVLIKSRNSMRLDSNANRPSSCHGMLISSFDTVF